MKLMGLIGGMSWESTQRYYQLMNQYVQAKLGGHHSIEAILYSVDFERILNLVHRDEWEAIAQEIADLAKKLERAGANFLLLTSNAIHKVFPKIQAALHIPILHIVDPTAQAIQKAGMKTVGLLGTKVTMEEDFFKDRLFHPYGIKALVPEDRDREQIHRIIFEELTLGKIHSDSRKEMMTLIKKTRIPRR